METRWHGREEMEKMDMNSGCMPILLEIHLTSEFVLLYYILLGWFIYLLSFIYFLILDVWVLCQHAYLCTTTDKIIRSSGTRVTQMVAGCHMGATNPSQGHWKSNPCS